MSTQQATASDYSFRLKDGVLGAQMLFVVFGALVLVPLLTGLDPNVALFTAGAGTLVFQIVSAGEFTLEGIALAAVLGVALNLVLPQPREERKDLEDEVEV